MYGKLKLQSASIDTRREYSRAIQSVMQDNAAAANLRADSASAAAGSSEIGMTRF
jgi:hypothetical protein